jgi:hypothetical protein
VEARHFFLFLSLVGAIVAVALARETHPVALLLLSAAVISAGLVGLAFHRALTGFWGATDPAAPLTEGARAGLEREKALTLRSIKELEFDHAMGKVNDADFGDLSARLRARAIALIEQIEHVPDTPADVPARAGRVTAAAPAPRPSTRVCPACDTPNDGDARFCKQCGAKLEA